MWVGNKELFVWTNGVSFIPKYLYVGSDFFSQLEGEDLVCFQLMHIFGL